MAHPRGPRAAWPSSAKPTSHHGGQTQHQPIASQDGASKEGAGRVALFRETHLTHLYTVEANYNAARVLNLVPAASGKHGGRASPPNARRISPRFTADVLHGAGRALLVCVCVCMRIWGVCMCV